MKPARILVVEDQVVVARDIKARLAALGYEPVGDATSATEALALAEELRPDLVLMDVRLQAATDGITAARQIRDRWQLPVVFLTAYAENATLEQAKLAEPYGYIIKPFEDRELHTVIEMALFKHQTEQQLRASEERYRLLAENSEDFVLMNDGAGRRLYVSPSYHRATGWTLADLEATDWRTRLHPDDLSAIDQTRAANLRGETTTLEHRIRCKDGSWLWVINRCRPVVGPDGQVQKLVMWSNDITQRKAHEREIERLSRLYATLSQINQAIARVRSRAELFQEVCRIGVEYGGFKLVWIGWPEPATHQINPLARAGDSEGFLDKVQVYADDRPAGHGSVGTCLRENRSCIINDFAGDPRLAPWHAVAAAHGLAAVASFPIRFHEVVWGTFTVYAGETGVFQDKEVALLSEMALDISFALDNLDREAQRQQAERAVRENELLLRNVIDLVPHHIFAKDRTGRFLFINHAAAAACGHHPAEMVGRLERELRPDAAHVENFLRDDQEVIDSGQPKFIPEEPVTYPDGQTHLLQTAKMPFTMPGTQERAVLGVAVDITARKQLEAERDITLRLLALLNSATNLRGLLRDVTGLLQEWSGCEAVGIRLRDGNDFPYYETRGFPAQFVQAENHLCQRDAAGQMVLDAQGQPLLECMCGNVLCRRFDPTRPFFTARGSFCSNHISADRQAFARNRCNGEGYESVVLIALRVGATIYGLLQFNDKRPDRFSPERLALLERLADNLAVAVAHRLSQEQYQLLSDHAEDIVTLKDIAGNFLYISPSYYRMTGWKPAEVETAAWNARLHPDDLPAIEQSRLANLAGRSTTVEHRIRCRDGSWIWVEAHCQPIRGADGQIQQRLTSSRNITERKRLEDQLRHSQKMEAVGQLAGGIAHDYNNILTATMMQLGLLLGRPDLSAEMRRALLDLVDGADRAASLTRQLLLFSRRSVMQVQTLNLNDVVDNLLKMLRRLIGEHINLQFHAQTALPRIDADAGMLEQVITNLAVNARDAMPDGGQLTIATEAVERTAGAAPDQPDARPGRFVCLNVTDTGCGMDAATLEHIFEPFFTTKDLGKGTGLGLATVYGIVQQHHGWITVESQPQRGTTFHIFLPVSTNAPTTTPEGLAAEPVRGGHETILLVEDEPSVRHMLTTVLQEWGYRVIETANGAEALRCWEQHQAEVDLLYTDMLMSGGLTGLALAERLRATKPALKVIISSGYSAELAHPSGVLPPDTTYVPKPCPAAELIATVRRTLDQAS